MIKKVVHFTLAICLTSPLALGANAQTMDISKLNPDLVAAANCSGMIAGAALGNYYIDIISEERAKNMIYGAALYASSVGFEKESERHLQEHMEDYSVYEQESIDYVLTSYQNDTFTWDDQSEVDNCTARMVGVITQPFPEQLSSQEVRDRLRGITDNRFDAMKRIYEAMK